MNKTHIVIRSIILKKLIELEHIPKALIEYARENKVLYVLGLYDDRVRKTEAWMELKRRHIAQKESIIEVMELAEKLGIRVLVVKTLKLFNYVPDDVDLLVIDDENLQLFVDELLERGYFLRKKGTPEVTLRRVTSNTYVDLDIHTKMGAGPYEYIDKHYLWQRRVYIKLDYGDIAAPNDIDELLITAAHAVLKEFKVTLADIIHVLSLPSLNKKAIHEATLQAKGIGLSKPLKYLLRLAYQTALPSLKERKQHDINTSEFPCKVPMPIIVSAYLENLRYRLRAHRLRPVKELTMIPSSKGIRALLRYIGL